MKRTRHACSRDYNPYQRLKLHIIMPNQPSDDEPNRGDKWIAAEATLLIMAIPFATFHALLH
jgi:hypothetical protein